MNKKAQAAPQPRAGRPASGPFVGARETKWLSSEEAILALRISSCTLAHRRLDGEIEFKKVGRRYFYLVRLPS